MRRSPLPSLIALSVALIVPFVAHAQTKKRSASPKPPAEEPVYAVADVMPEFVGGHTALRSYLMKNIQFPEAAIGAPINGPIQVSFIVRKDGQVTDASIVQGQHPALDAEALRLVIGMPPWTPGKQRGKTVQVLYTMPIRFGVHKSSTAPLPQVAQAKPAAITKP